MQRVARSAVIDASPEAVFDVIADLDRLAAWQSGIVETRRTSDGPIGVGARARVVRQLMGQRLEAPITVTAYDRPRLISVESTVAGVHATAILDVAPLDHGKSEVTFTMELNASGLTALMEPVIASAASGDLADSLERLGALLGRD